MAEQSFVQFPFEVEHILLHDPGPGLVAVDREVALIVFFFHFCDPGIYRKDRKLVKGKELDAVCYLAANSADPAQFLPAEVRLL